jgi:hypothetical protein
MVNRYSSSLRQAVTAKKKRKKTKSNVHTVQNKDERGTTTYDVKSVICFSSIVVFDRITASLRNSHIYDQKMVCKENAHSGSQHLGI